MKNSISNSALMLKRRVSSALTKFHKIRILTAPRTTEEHMTLLSRPVPFSESKGKRFKNRSYYRIVRTPALGQKTLTVKSTNRRNLQVLKLRPVKRQDPSGL